MRVLTYTTLYPSAAAPTHGVFVEERLRHIAAEERVRVCVVAPTPWFPFRHPRFGRYAVFARTPLRETRYGLPISHPRYPVIPKIGTPVAPDLLYLFTRRPVAAAMNALGRADLLDAHYFYPDGVAAARLADRFSLPLVITARGADINTIALLRRPGARVRTAADRATTIITVSRSLKQRLVALGVSPDKIEVIENGVDLDVFAPVSDRETLRARHLKARDEILLLSVGQLIERKGHDLTIQALPRLPRHRLLIAGEGPLRTALEHLAREHDVAQRVEFLGLRPHRELRDLYAAADLTVLASHSEGMANVMLESLACGTPVVATPVDGALEIVSDPRAGRLTEGRSVDAVVDGIRAAVEDGPHREDVRSYAENFPWRSTARRQVAVYKSVMEKRPA
jgi:glycosyltransferase involved in cell wall biosynthesis